LPIVERGEQPLCYNSYKYSYKKVFPPGAGLVIRKQAWLESVPETLRLKGPVGQSLSAKGEDIEALTYIALAGWEIWYNPEMHIAHRIPKSRLEREYLMRFFRGIGLSRYQTRRLNYKAWQRPFVLPAYMANDLRKIMLHFLKYRRLLRTDAIAACEMEFFISSFLSPLYAWKKQLFG
jgi:GT2 family glycosyltransferase